jgi:hypothetical protein
MRPTNGQPKTDQTTDQTTDRRVTVAEAAALLGLSEGAVRSRLKRGTLRKEKAKDGKVLVVLASEGSTGRSTTDSDQTTTDQTADQGTLVEVLREQLAYLRDQLDHEREANRENRRIIAGLVQRVPELEPPKEDPPSGSQNAPGTVLEEGDEGDPAQEPEKRSSWWRRFFGFEKTA